MNGVNHPNVYLILSFGVEQTRLNKRNFFLFIAFQLSGKMLKIDKAEYLIKWAHGYFIIAFSLLVSVFEIFIFEIKRALYS